MRGLRFLAGVASAALAALAPTAGADDVAVLTPHVQDSVDAAAREAARRIGEAIRRRLAAGAPAGEARTLPIIAEALRCDARTAACLGEVAAQLGAERVLSGELDWRGRRLVLQDHRRGGAARTIEAGVSDDVLEAELFDAWIEHVLRRLGGAREGTVVLRETGDAPSDTEVRLGARLMQLELPSFVPAGRHEVAIARHGERLLLGALEVRDGRRHERFINFRSVTMGSGGGGELDPLGVFEDEPVSFEGRVLASGYAGVDALTAVLTARGELDLRRRRLVMQAEVALGGATGDDGGSRHTGLAWTYRTRAGVGTLPGDRVGASLSAGLGGSGITGLVAPAFELPVLARVALAAPLRPTVQLGAAFTLDDDRADGTHVPFAGDLEASLELSLMRSGKRGRLRGLVARLGYRELADQWLFGFSVGYVERNPLGERRRPTLTDEADPLGSLSPGS